MPKIYPGSNEVVFQGETLKYFCKESENDRRKVILIFSGFRPAGTLDFFGNSIKPIRNEVIWLHDAFGENSTESYYLFSRGENGPERAVTEFIDNLISERGITRQDVIVAGFSKGGSAALYFAYKLGLGACVTGVPQFAIGSYVKNNWPAKYSDFSGDRDDFIEIADKYIRECIEESEAAPPVYLITSEADPQYKHEILPNLSLLADSKHFNMVKTESKLVGSHVEVTPYNVPMIQSLFLMLSEGIEPRFGLVQNGFNEDPQKNYEINAESRFDAYLNELKILDGYVSLEYDSIIRGVTNDKHGLTDRRISIGESFVIPTGSIYAEENSKKYYQSSWVDYSYTRTRPVDSQGIALECFPEGVNLIVAQTRSRISGGSWIETPIVSKREFTELIFWGGYYYWFQCGVQGVYISKFPINSIMQLKPDPLWNKLHKIEVDNKNRTMEIQGRLLPHGVTAGKWGEVYYQLLFESDTSTIKLEPLGQLERPIKNYPPSTNKSYFSNRYNSPISLESLESGKWTVQVIGRSSQMIFSSGSLAVLNVDKKSIQLQKI